MRRRLNAPRRRAPKRAAVEGEEGGVEFQTFLTDVCPMQIPDCVYNCDSFQRKIDLAKLWHRRPVVGEDSLMLANDTVAALMRCMVDNKYRPVDPRAYEAAKDMQIEGILSNLVRMQSQKQMTLLTARISVAAYRYQLPHNMWRIIHSLAPGLLASIPWTDELIHLANQFRPSCAYKTLDGVGGTLLASNGRWMLLPGTTPCGPAPGSAAPVPPWRSGVPRPPPLAPEPAREPEPPPVMLSPAAMSWLIGK